MEDKSKQTTHKGLSVWQLVMMALGTVIGGSFFLGSSVAIEAAGPAILLAFVFGGILVYYILYALSEMTVSNPAPGNFRTYATEAYGPGAGFVVGWVYWTGMALAMSSEATAVSILIRQWYPNVPIALLGSIIIVVVTLLNLLGADKLSKLESGLSIVKILAIAAFIVIGLVLIAGLIPGAAVIGAGELRNESLLPGGIAGIAGSMLIVMFSYAGFEVIGLAASETANPEKTVPKAINVTVLSLVVLYVISIAIMLPLIPTSILNEETSPMVAALNRWGMGWAGTAINFVLMTAILSTMLATMFGLGRMIRSLADAGQAPSWLKDERDIPKRGILFSGFGMLVGLGVGLLLPRVYLFLVSSGGFSALLTYTAIVATHIRFRRKNGCPTGKIKMRGYPYSSLFVLISLIVIIISMPLIPGQGYGFIAGLVITCLYYGIYFIMKFTAHNHDRPIDKNRTRFQDNLSTEFSEELTDYPTRNSSVYVEENATDTLDDNDYWE